MEFANFLIEEKNLRKIFGEKEILIIRKQIHGIKLTPSEQTRLSRDIRKKFEIVGSLINFENEFDLKKGSLIKAIVEESKEIILKNVLFSNLDKIILYGSVVQNKVNFSSDIDIALVLKNVSQREASKMRVFLLGKLNERVDLQIYNFLDEKIKKEIDKFGKVIYESKD